LLRWMYRRDDEYAIVYPSNAYDDDAGCYVGCG
jgi:hypothetical protein